MAYQVIVKKRFTNKVQKVLEYLEKEWSHKVAADFLQKIDRRITLLTKQPHVGAPSAKIKEIRGLLISKHNRLYYKIKGDKVIVEIRVHLKLSLLAILGYCLVEATCL